MKILYPLAKRFIAGHDFDSAKPKIQKLMDEGFEVSVDYLGELSTSARDCRIATRQYIEIIKYYSDKKIDISIKPSQLGLLINPAVSYNNLDLIAKTAKQYGHTIRLDMEDSKVTELTRNQAISLNKKYGNVGVAIQANLYRTEEDLKILIDNNVSVRLVKGAYKESEDIARQDQFSIGSNFFHYAATLYSSKSKNPAIATHDEELLEDVQELIPDPSRFDYEMLYGIRRDLQKSLLNKQYRVRIYIPFGEQWLPYTLRRLREWKNLKFVIKNIFYEIFRR
jgi:proline dehydrogenase